MGHVTLMLLGAVLQMYLHPRVDRCIVAATCLTIFVVAWIFEAIWPLRDLSRIRVPPGLPVTTLFVLPPETVGLVCMFPRVLRMHARMCLLPECPRVLVVPISVRLSLVIVALLA